MLRRLVYPQVEPLLNKTVRVLAERKITPNQLTLAGAVLNIVAGLFYAEGLFFLAGFAMILAALGDLLDGPLARTTGQATPFGAFLDSTVDRYSDFFLFGGLSLYYAGRGEWGWFLTVLGIILGAFVTSYTKARSETLIPSCSVGFLERAERILLLVLGSLISPLLPWMLALLLVGTHATAIQRILFVRKTLKQS